MNAMEQASKNASELIDELTVKMNKLRQAQITTELNEIISGANAISG
jgi:F-type H+-transporting ATPase subunit gamma